jgi:lipopolysaccharide export system permease protein
MLRARTLRRYVALRFVTMILSAFVICAALIFMIDLIELLRIGGKNRAITLWQLGYVGMLRLPSFTELLMPFAVLVGSIGALLSLGRRSELTVMRSGGMSVWQFIRPGLTVAVVIGVAAVLGYNPLAAAAKAESERLMADWFGRDVTLTTSSDGAGSWLRQNGADGPSVLNARAVAEQGLVLAGVTAFQYDSSGRFVERIDADRGHLRSGYWELQGALVTRPGQDPAQFSTYHLGTALDRDRVQNALGSVESVDVWDLPGVIEMSERAQLPAARFKVQYHLLLSRPFLLAAMVLLAATVSLRSFRQGGVQTMVAIGSAGGIALFLMTEMSRQLGLAGLVPASVAVWTPVSLASLAALTVLLHQEDG